MLFGKQPPVSRRNMVKQLGVAAAVSGLALTGSPLFALADSSNVDNYSKGADDQKPSGINVLLVHGAFADASSWSRVANLLQRKGHNVLAVQIPLSSLADDIAVTQQALASLNGPTVIAGHSYGGAVVTGAATNASNVIGLVYASAFVPAEGEVLGGLIGSFPPPEGAAYTVPSYRAGFAWIVPANFPQIFAADVPLPHAQVMAVSQKPIAFNCFAEQAGPAAWKNLPSWYIVSKQDKAINPDLERFMAKRCGATTVEIDSSHASLVSHPEVVVSLIQAAIRNYQKA